MYEAARNLKRDDALTDMAFSADGGFGNEETIRHWTDLCLPFISMDSGKVLDIQPMSRFCKSCSVHERHCKTH